MTDEGAILYPTFPCRRRDLSPRRLSSPAPLGNPVAPSSAPVCALGHLPPKGKALGGESAAGQLRDYYGTHVYPLIWKPSFAKMLASIFFSENASQIGLSILEGIAPQTDQRQRSPNPASGNDRPSKPGVQGRSPGPLSPHFSGEMGTPAGQAGQRGAAPRGLGKAPPTRRVRSTASPQAPGPTCGAPPPSKTTRI